MAASTTTDLLPRLTDAAAGAAREATDSDAVDGMPCRWVVRPPDTAAVAAVLRVAHAEGLAVVTRGTGTKLGWGAPPERLDLVLDTTRLDRLVEHASGDLIAVVGAGRRLDDLQTDLAAAGQWLAVDPARRGTVGGLVATADSGPSRLLHGPVRDLVIGMTMVRADGVVARSGGKVVKNVAGYDLGKLLTGSIGTLGVITEVAVRLHPVAPAHRFVTVPVASTQHVHALVQGVIHSHLVATACQLDRPAGGGGGGGGGATLAVRVDGILPGVEARTAAALELLGARAESGEEAPSWWGRDPGVAGDVTLRLTHEIASVTALLETLDEVADRASIPVDVRGSVAVGAVTAALRTVHDRAAVADLVDALRVATARAVGAGGTGGTVVVRDADPETKARVDVWGPVPALDLMRRVKDQFDPTRVLAPGRFVGGI